GTKMSDANYPAPSCIAGFELQRTTPKSRASQQQGTAFALSCKCGSKEGAVLGYPLRDLRRDYTGTQFVGPLAFTCSSCQQLTEIIDSDVHGYHGALKRYLGESSPPATISGKGVRKTFECPNCSGTMLRVTAEFFYSGAEQDIEEEEHTGHVA